MKLSLTLCQGISASYSPSLGSDTPTEDWEVYLYLTTPSSSVEVEGLRNGDDWVFVFNSSETAALAARKHQAAIVAKKGAAADLIAEFTAVVKPDPTKAHDRRTQAERTLDAVRAMLEGKATDDQQMVQYDGRTISRYTFEALIQLENKLTRRVQRERNRKAGHSGILKTRRR